MIAGDNGISWWQSWLCVWIGYSIAGCFICLTGRIGATYHISFPVIARASFGTWGSLWPVFNRAAMACIWYGVQAWIGGELNQSLPLIPALKGSFTNPTQQDNASPLCFARFGPITKTFPIPFHPQARIRVITSHSSSSGSALSQPSGFPFTKSAICSPSKHTSHLLLVSPFSFGRL